MKTYEQPSMEILKMESGDVITASTLTEQEYETGSNGKWSEWF